MGVAVRRPPPASMMSMLKPGVGLRYAAGERAGPVAEPSNPRVKYMLEKSQREPISNDMMDWQIVRASRQPGPGGAGGGGPEGEHRIPGMSDLKGWPGGEVGRGRLPRAKPPGFIEQIMAHSNDSPSPFDTCDTGGKGIGKGVIKAGVDKMTGGRMGNGVERGMLGWVEYYEGWKPGPGYYDPEGTPGPEMIEMASKRINGAGAASLKNDPTNLTIVAEEKRARGIPAPHDYDVNRSYTHIHPKKGTKMARERKVDPKTGKTTSVKLEKSLIEWVQHVAAQTPGPGGTYDVEGSFAKTQDSEFKGTKMGATNIGKRYVQILIEPRARATPGPGAHDLSAYEASKGMSCLKTNGPGKDGKGGFSFAGRPSVGEMPAPFSHLSEPVSGSSDIRTGDHSADASYIGALTPWRASERYMERSQNKADKSGISWLSEESMRKGEAGSFGNITDYTAKAGRRKLQKSKLPGSFMTKRAFTMGVNAKRCAEYFESANASFNALEIGGGGSYGECEEVAQKFKDAQELWNSSVAMSGGPTPEMLAEGVERASVELDNAKVREAAAKAPKPKK